jgi:hypothetical protein
MSLRAGAQPSPLIGRLQLQQRRHQAFVFVTNSVPYCTVPSTGRGGVYCALHILLQVPSASQLAPKQCTRTTKSCPSAQARESSFWGCSPSNRDQQIAQHLPAPLIPAADKDQAAGRLTRIRARTGEYCTQQPPAKDPKAAKHRKTQQAQRLSSERISGAYIHKIDQSVAQVSAHPVLLFMAPPARSN